LSPVRIFSLTPSRRKTSMAAPASGANQSVYFIVTILHEHSPITWQASA